MAFFAVLIRICMVVLMVLGIIYIFIIVKDLIKRNTYHDDSDAKASFMKQVEEVSKRINKIKENSE